MQQLPLFSSSSRKKLFFRFPWGVFFIILLWVSLGLINLYSATYRFDQPGASLLFRSQLLWICIGLGLLFFLLWMDTHFFFEYSYLLYGFSILLLLLVFFFGRSVAGQQNWIVIGKFSFQPSELAKLAFILALSRFYSEKIPREGLSFKVLLLALLLLILPTSLILLQKDLGGSLFFILLFFTLTFFTPFKIRYVLLIFCVGALACFALYQWGLKPYQKDRIKIFMNPEKDPRGSGYHLMQSKIAVGSGGLIGKGYLKGNMNKLKFLPERHTDFIFPVLAEEWGFAGAALSLAVMLIFLLLGIEAAYQTKDAFGSLVSLGIVGLFFWHLVINLGGVLGLLPLTGVPLPFFSYGGSSVLTMMMAVGLLMNIRMGRYMF
ncbi:MAG: rod shape-determining protein RodA [Deltaproteobacteria bacterium]|nr:rod shape-determining protein RodA [Deltaproteobacteria bacterium]